MYVIEKEKQHDDIFGNLFNNFNKMEKLTITNLRLLDLYQIPIDTLNNEVAEIFINQEVIKKQEELIKITKEKCK